MDSDGKETSQQSPRARDRRLWAYFCLTMMGICFGSMTPVAKDAMQGGVPQFLLTGLRMWGTALFFWILTAGRPPVPVPRRDLALMALAGFLGVVCDQGGYILGLSMTSPIDAGVICTMIPVFALVLGVVFRGQRPGLLRLAGIAVGLAGAVTMVLSSAGTGGRSGTVLGDAVVIAALLCFSCYLVFFTDLIARYPVATLMKWMFLFSALMMTPMMVHSVSGGTLAAIGTGAWLETAYVVTFGTIFAFMFMLEGQKHCSPEVVGVFNYIQPVVTCALAVAMGLGELTPAKAAGAALIFAGVFAVSRSRG